MVLTSTSMLLDAGNLNENLLSEEELFKKIMLTVETVWKNDLSKKDIEKWLANFKGEVFDIKYEKHLALWLLANFVYYNEKEVRHLCKILYHDFIHQMLLNFDKRNAADIAEVLENIHRGSIFYYLGNPGESGSHILYYFRQENELPIRNFISRLDELPEYINTVVFVDDVTLAGDQAEKYIKKEKRSSNIDKTTILLTFFSTCEAAKLLEKQGIRVISSIILDETCKCFSKNSYVFYHFQKHLDNCRQLAEAYGKKLKPKHPLGYMNGQYTFGFFYNTPDNTLPIFWAENQGWNPIIKRYDKNYGLRICNEEFRTFV